MIRFRDIANIKILPPFFTLAIHLCNFTIAASSENPPSLADQPRNPPGSLVTIEMNPPVAWYREPYTVTVRYENSDNDELEIFLPRENWRRPYKLLVFDASKNYIGDLLKTGPGLNASGGLYPSTCHDWTRVPAGGIVEHSIRLPGGVEMPPAGRYFLQLSLGERFFSACPFREERCRLLAELRSDGHRDPRAHPSVQTLIASRMQEWSTAKRSHDAARSNALEVRFNDRRPPAKREPRKYDDSTRPTPSRPDEDRPKFGATLTATGALTSESSVDVMVLLDTAEIQSAIYNAFFDRRSELPATLQLRDAQGNVVVDDLLGRAATLTEAPRAELFLEQFRDRAGARFRLSMDRSGTLTVRTNGTEVPHDVRLATGRYQLMCAYYQRAFRLRSPDSCHVTDSQRDAWKSTDPAAVQFRTKSVEFDVKVSAD